MTVYKTQRHILVKTLRASGLRNSEVAAQLGIKPSAASAMYRYQPTGRRKGRECGVNGERARALREQGVTFSAIGKVLGCSRQGAHALCHYRASDEFRGRG